MRIAPFTSVFLDGLRFFAALGIVFVHLGNSQLLPHWTALQPYGSNFVVAFFVLSGYVIAATSNPERSDAVRYFSVRLGRLWSVALPALSFAFVLQLLGRHFAPDFFTPFDRGNSALRYLLAASFTNEMWFISAGPPMDSPVWSLAYEFWFYLLFGVVVFVKSRAVRFLTLALVVVAIGPKILALLPVWLLGVAAWKLTAFARARTRWADLLILLSLGLIVGMIMVHPRWPGMVGYAPLYFSGEFLSNGVLGLGVAALIVGVDARFHECGATGRWASLLKAGAGVSFSLYLLHFPLMVSCAGLLPYDHGNPLQAGAILLCVLLVVYLFGIYFEPLRKPWAHRIEMTLRGLLSHSPASTSKAGDRPQTALRTVNTGSAPLDAEP